MVKKKDEIEPTEQSKKFLEEAQKLIDAGELNPTEADKRFDATLNHLRSRRADGEGNSLRPDEDAP